MLFVYKYYHTVGNTAQLVKAQLVVKALAT